MPTLPYAVTELPAKPLKPLDQYTTAREEAHRRSAQAGMWTASQPYSSSGYDDRRSQYSSRSSYHQGSSSSSSLAGAYTTSASQPSPSTSATSTASSLRTPPDLLLNGSSLASSLSAPFSGYKGMTRLNAKGKTVAARNDKVHLSIDQLQSRLRMLSQLPSDLLSGDLPTPPSSPRRMESKEMTREDKKRKASSSSEKSDEDNKSRNSNKRRQNGETTMGGSSRSVAWRDDSSVSAASQWEPPVAREWTKELYFETAVVYRQRGRELKHRGDQRRRDVSTSKRLASSPEKESLIASLEQTDALLLYMYGFWCEDQACGGSCVVANWTSLYGLLKYVYLNHEKSKMPLLAGLCRLLEAVVLRHVASHEMRLMNHRLTKAVASTSGLASSQSPGSTTTAAPSPSSSDSIQQTLAEVSETMARIVTDNERSARLMQQCKQSILNLAALQETYPRVARLCEKSMANRTWNAVDQALLATRIDPSGGLDPSDDLASSVNGWVWPIDLGTPFPLIVCFGRAVLREAAQEARLSFAMEPVRMP